jgi:NAD-dependent DNA ligase
MDEATLNRFGGDRLSNRQIDELIGLARGLIADGKITQDEAEFLRDWLSSNAGITQQPLLKTLYRRIADMLADGTFDDEERRELLDTLRTFSGGRSEIGEALKPTNLPLCDPAPTVVFADRRFCFTGTFMFGQRKVCERAVLDRGGTCGSLNRSTNFLVIGAYATESWKHSTFGLKILKAVEMREKRIKIRIVAEEHWRSFL